MLEIALSTTAFFLFIGALGSQYLSLFRASAADGVSWQAYLIGGISDILVIANSHSIEVKILSAVHLFLVSGMTIYVLYLQHKTNYQFKENIYQFLFSLGCSFLMITGVSQGIKTYLSKGRKSQVSFWNYFLQSANLSIMIFLENNILVILPLSVSLILHLYISYRARALN